MNIKRANLYAGAIIGSLLFFLLVNFFANLIYFGPEHHGEEGEETLAYALDTGEAAGEGQTGGGEEAVDLAALAAAADPAQGAKLFSKCKSCHSLDEGVNKVGPSLHGVVGRPIASVEGFSYSEGLKAHAAEKWTLENLAAFLHNPKEFAPGTKMTFAGFKKPEDAVAVIVYLNEASGNPVPLGEEKKAAAEEPAGEAAPATAEAEAAAQPEQPAAAEPAGATTAPEATESATQAAPDSANAATAAGAGESSDLLASADVERGKKVFNKCKACHSLEAGVNKLGPSLHGVVGRPVASVEGFNYSAAMKAKGGTWTVEALDAFLTKPKMVVPGTKMSFPGLKKSEDRAAVIAYLKAQGG